jgi:hypothetical protein
VTSDSVADTLQHIRLIEGAPSTHVVQNVVAIVDGAKGDGLALIDETDIGEAALRSDFGFGSVKSVNLSRNVA